MDKWVKFNERGKKRVETLNKQKQAGERTNAWLKFNERKKNYKQNKREQGNNEIDNVTKQMLGWIRIKCKRASYNKRNAIKWKWFICWSKKQAKNNSKQKEKQTSGSLNKLKIGEQVNKEKQQWKNKNRQNKVSKRTNKYNCLG